MILWQIYDIIALVSSEPSNLDQITEKRSNSQYYNYMTKFRESYGWPSSPIQSNGAVDALFAGPE
jgi:hypothetical protein